MIHICNDKNLLLAAECIKNGGVVAFPTETVYGLGGDAFNENAIARIFEIKRRPFFDPLIVHISSLDMLDCLVNFNEFKKNTQAQGNISQKQFETIITQLMPGPLSIILPKSEKLPHLVSGGLETVAIRFPAHQAAQKLIRLSGCPIAAPSANLFGQLSPTSALHVEGQLGSSVEIIIDGGDDPEFGIESTVLDLSSNKLRILRSGGTEQSKIESILGCHIEIAHDDNVLKSPGLLKNHYAPYTKLFLLSEDKMQNLSFTSDAAYLFFNKESFMQSRCSKESQAKNIFILSKDGTLLSAAASLFSILHKIDSKNYTQIYAQSAPCRGIGIAINDRLSKAAVK
ncbi:MAG: threonylcarbamoyl-AMP synthase [Spirochaetaceae bacterium]|jgi:L-threonylcarbamoyladenylate synthase|nr:threonylcarbamoyl-AMP synthase [Spirochaetaceae bacterium]